MDLVRTESYCMRLTAVRVLYTVKGSDGYPLVRYVHSHLVFIKPHPTPYQTTRIMVLCQLYVVIFAISTPVP